MQAVWALVYKQWKYRVAYRWNIVNLTIGPFFIVGPYVFASDMYASRSLTQMVAVGVIIWYWFSMFFWGVGYGMRDEMEEGTFESVAVAPGGLGILLAAKGVDSLVVSVYMSISSWVMLHAFARLDMPKLSWTVLAVILASAVAFAGCGLVLASVNVLAKRAVQVGDVIQQTAGIFSGMTAPTSVLPRAMRLASLVIPLTYAIEAARQALSGRAPGQQLWILSAFALGIWFGGMVLMRYAYERSRVSGTLGEY